MTLLFLIAPAAVSALIAFALTPLARKLAVAVGAVDLPGPRKIHLTPTPRLGGLAVIAAVATVLTVLSRIDQSVSHVLASYVLRAVVIGIAPIVFVSIIDDIRPLSPLPKFVAHIGGASITVLLGVRLGDVIHMFGREVNIGWLAIPVSIVWLAGITNAFNIVDGLDGLSAGLALIAAISLAAVSIVNGRYEMASAAGVLAGALAGFLPYNTFPAKIYLGDTGSTAIGFFLGTLTLRGGSTATAGLAVSIPILVVGVPIAETLLSMLRRVVRRLQGGTVGIMDADRDHVHHRLLARGFTHKRAVITLYAIGVLVAVCAFASVFLNQQNTALLLVTLFAAAVVGVAKLGYDEFAVIRSGAVLRVYEKPVLRTGFFVVFADMALVVMAIYITIALKYDDWSVHDHRLLAINLLAFAPAATVATFGLMGIYRRSWSNASIDDLAISSAAIMVASAVAMILVRFLSDVMAPLTFFAMYAVIALGVLNGSRASYRVLYHWNKRSSQEGQPVVIYGAGRTGALAIREILTNDGVPMRPIGFIDDDPMKLRRYVNGYPVLGSLDALDDLVRLNRASGVIIASAKIPISNVRAAQRVCEARGAWVRTFRIDFADDACIGTEPAHTASKPVHDVLV